MEMDYYLKGSVLRETVSSGCRQVRTHFEVESDAPPETIRNVIRVAKRGCFAENLIRAAVPLRSTIHLNGEPVPFEE
ncbi:MAG: hypothetical protein A3F84_16245 [Candidatus Handelsmanbacteria bacterium RIFCSPLOWO2_12_FULL_64_10]|uniref:Osmotically inducible protein OsmC n=1 Tax=Handelsmanbacteria sp. (strain RIFCSPLOWO2_12_FULL_64_10) TaxID=1817868 RepID=A0A1F6CJ59_HANXR|nr:MAG: hypothetical protein A3F84_16245 [Candidatus Handelsmanbacteria bacterium RIFCSPLOWO2_12_FULL_64_10]